MGFPFGFGGFDPYRGNNYSWRNGYFSDEEDGIEELIGFYNGTEDDVIMEDACETSGINGPMPIEVQPSGPENEVSDVQAAAIIEDDAAIESKEEEEETSANDIVILESSDGEKGRFPVSLAKVARWGNVDALKIPFTNPRYPSFTSRETTLDFSASLLKIFSTATDLLSATPTKDVSSAPASIPEDIARAVDYIGSQIHTIEEIYELIKFAEFYNIPQLIRIAKEKIRDSEMLQSIEEESIKTLWDDALEKTTETHYRKLILELLLFYHLQRDEYDQAAKSLDCFFTYFSAQDFLGWLIAVPPEKSYLSFFIEKLVSMGAKGAIGKELKPDLSTVVQAESSAQCEDLGKDKAVEDENEALTQKARRIAKGKEKVPLEEEYSVPNRCSNSQNHGIELAFELLSHYTFYQGAEDEAFDKKTESLEKESEEKPVLAEISHQSNEEAPQSLQGIPQLEPFLPPSPGLPSPQQTIPFPGGTPYQVDSELTSRMEEEHLRSPKDILLTQPYASPASVPTSPFMQPIDLDQAMPSGPAPSTPYAFAPEVSLTPPLPLPLPAPFFASAPPEQTMPLLFPLLNLSYPLPLSGFPLPQTQQTHPLQIDSLSNPQAKKSAFPFVYMHTLFTLANKVDSFDQAVSLLSYCAQISYGITAHERFSIVQLDGVLRPVDTQSLMHFVSHSYQCFTCKESIVSTLILQLAFDALVAKRKKEEALLLILMWMKQIAQLEEIDLQAAPEIAVMPPIIPIAPGPVSGIEASLKLALTNAFYSSSSFEDLLYRMELYLSIRHLWKELTKRDESSIEPDTYFDKELMNTFFKDLPEKEYAERLQLLIKLFPDRKQAHAVLPNLITAPPDFSAEAPGLLNKPAGRKRPHGKWKHAMDASAKESYSSMDNPPILDDYTELLTALKTKGRHAALKRFRTAARVKHLNEEQLHNVVLNFILPDLDQYDVKKILKFARFFDEKFEELYIGKILGQLFDDNKFKEFLEVQSFLKPEEKDHRKKILKDRLAIAEKMLKANQIEPAIEFLNTHFLPFFNDYSSSLNYAELTPLFNELISARNIQTLQFMEQALTVMKEAVGALPLCLAFAMQLSNSCLDTMDNGNAARIARSFILPSLRLDKELQRFFNEVQTRDEEINLFPSLRNLIERFIRSGESKTALRLIKAINTNWKIRKRAKVSGPPVKKARVSKRIDKKFDLNSLLPAAIAANLKLKKPKTALALLNKFKNKDRKFTILTISLAHLGDTHFLEHDKTFSRLLEFTLAEIREGGNTHLLSTPIFNKLFEEAILRLEFKTCASLYKASLDRQGTTPIDPKLLAAFVQAVILDSEPGGLENSFPYIEELLKGQANKTTFSLYLGQKIGELPKEFQDFDFIMKVKNSLPTLCQYHFLSRYLNTLQKSNPEMLLSFVTRVTATFEEAFLLEANLQQQHTSYGALDRKVSDVLWPSSIVQRGTHFHYFN